MLAHGRLPHIHIHIVLGRAVGVVAAIDRATGSGGANQGIGADGCRTGGVGRRGLGAGADIDMNHAVHRGGHIGVSGAERGFIAQAAAIDIAFNSTGENVH